jgi:nucleoside-diphosphate-sugar epimerase
VASLFDTFFYTIITISLSVMITVAIAGGTGGIGKTIVEELASVKKYNIVVLSRTVSHFLSIDQILE